MTCFSVDEESCSLATGTKDGTVMFWDVNDWSKKGEIRPAQVHDECTTTGGYGASGDSGSAVSISMKSVEYGRIKASSNCKLPSPFIMVRRIVIC